MSLVVSVVVVVVSAVVVVVVVVGGIAVAKLIVSLEIVRKVESLLVEKHVPITQTKSTIDETMLH